MRCLAAFMLALSLSGCNQPQPTRSACFMALEVVIAVHGATHLLDCMDGNLATYEPEDDETLARDLAGQRAARNDLAGQTEALRQDALDAAEDLDDVDWNRLVETARLLGEETDVVRERWLSFNDRWRPRDEPRSSGGS